MAFTIKTIVKLFILFLVFQISINFLVEYLPTSIPNYTEDDKNYLDFVKAKTNGKMNAEDESQSLLDNFIISMETENLFDDSIIDTFLGIFQVIGNFIRFLVEIALLILFTPMILMEILLYNFIASSSILFAVTLAIDIFFYMILFYIIYKARTSN